MYFASFVFTFPGLVILFLQVDVHCRPCEFENCSKHPHYAFEGDKARFCATHKEVGMVDVKHKRCHTTGCRVRSILGAEPRLAPNLSRHSLRVCNCSLRVQPNRCDNTERCDTAGSSVSCTQRGSFRPMTLKKSHVVKYTVVCACSRTVVTLLTSAIRPDHALTASDKSPQIVVAMPSQMRGKINIRRRKRKQHRDTCRVGRSVTHRRR